MHRQHTPDLTTPPTWMQRRAEASLDLIFAITLAMLIGFGLIAACLG